MPRLVIVTVEGVDLEGGGVVDQNVDSAETVDHGLNHGFNLLGIGDVGADGDRLTLADVANDGVCIGLTPMVVHADSRAGQGHSNRRFPPDSARGAGDQRRFTA